MATLNNNDDVTNFVHTNAGANDKMTGVWYSLTPSLTINKIIIINRQDGCCKGRLKGTTLVLNDIYRNPFYESDPIMGPSGSTTYSEDNDGYDIYSFIFPEKKPIGQNISDIGITNYNKLITTNDDVLTTRPNK